MHVIVNYTQKNRIIIVVIITIIIRFPFSLYYYIQHETISMKTKMIRQQKKQSFFSSTISEMKITIFSRSIKKFKRTKWSLELSRSDFKVGLSKSVKHTTWVLFGFWFRIKMCLGLMIYSRLWKILATNVEDSKRFLSF